MGEVRARTRGGLTALVWKDRQEVYTLTNMNHHQKGIFVTIATTSWHLTSWNVTTGTWVTMTILIVWLIAIR